MEKMCALVLKSKCKKTPAMMELLKKKENTKEEEKEILMSYGMVVRDAVAVGGNGKV